MLSRREMDKDAQSEIKHFRQTDKAEINASCQHVCDTKCFAVLCESILLLFTVAYQNVYLFCIMNHNK